MMNHRDLLTSLTEEQRQQLMEKTNSDGISRLSCFVLLIGGLATAISAAVAGWQILILPLGILLVFLFTLQHETVHKTPFASQWLNTAVGHLCGLILFLPPVWFQYFHLAHHRHTQDPEKDPELSSEKPDNWWKFLHHVSGLPLWISLFKTLFANAFLTPEYSYVPQTGYVKIRREALYIIVIYGVVLALSLITHSTILFWVWIVPLIVGQPFLRLYLLAEHGRCPMVADMLQNSRTTYTNSLVRWLAWNMPYHAEHHAIPTVPFHKLSKLNALTRDHLTSVSNGYVEFHRTNVQGFKETTKPSE